MSSTGIAASNRVVSQNRFGRFIRAIEDGATDTVRDLIEEGANISRALAPVGSKVDRRTIPLAQSIETEMLSSTQGRWKATARHALAQEHGGRPHDIPGDVYFFWEREHRWWEPGDNVIQHPGNAPQPYLQPAFDQIRTRALEIMRRRMPG